VTAEIAILNIEAVALAADSAVTVRTASGAVKIFNSANKLLALSSYHPVGVMVYGNASLMGFHWETIVKQFRDELGRQEFDTLAEYAAALFAHLNSMTPTWFSSELQEEHLRSVVASAYEEVRTQILEEVEDRLERSSSMTETQVSRIGGTVVGERLRLWRDLEFLDGHSERSIREVDSSVREMVTELKEEVLESFPFSTAASDKLDRIGILAVFKFRPREGESSGVVVAGFGREQLMPCLESFEIAGIGLDRVRFKRNEQTSRCISHENTASIVPFAQSQVVAAFMEGIDPELLRTLGEFRDRLFSSLPAAIVKGLSSGSARTKAAISSELAAALDATVKQIERFLEYIRYEHYAHPVVATIAHMPRDELARVAETLVSLASFRQRVTMADETVGGPIDVAVISKGDGFIWIKRKHYFDPTLNQRFIARLYGNEGATDGETKQESTIP
jgi:hypothetical protein